MSTSSFIASLLLAAGGAGLAYTIFAPLLVAPLALLSRRRYFRLSNSRPLRPFEVSIFVPAKNEEETISSSLHSVLDAIERLEATHPGSAASVVVGLDGCTDSTEERVREVASQRKRPIGVFKPSNGGGKWHSLVAWTRSLKGSPERWVCFVDCGSLWDPGLLACVSDKVSGRPDVVGVGPAYMPSKAGVLEKLNWGLERSLKTLENFAGGPTSLHGATVLYRSDVLQAALSTLGAGLWLNDDVVVPLSIRLADPAASILYLGDRVWVRDIGVRKDLGVEYRRRRRMVVGNLQWIRDIWAPSFSVRNVASWTALRRVARSFWAYWVLLISAGLVIEGTARAGIFGFAGFVVAVAVAVLASEWVRRVAMAFFSGVRAPLSYFRQERGEISWV